jgi:hypothetical protein
MSTAARLDAMCVCGCVYRIHCHTAPHYCKRDFRAWWPELIPVGCDVAVDHCAGFQEATDELL